MVVICQKPSLIQENLSKLDPSDRLGFLIKPIPFVYAKIKSKNYNLKKMKNDLFI